MNNKYLHAIRKVNDVEVLRAQLVQFFVERDQLRNEIQELRKEKRKLSDSLTSMCSYSTQ